MLELKIPNQEVDPVFDYLSEIVEEGARCENFLNEFVSDLPSELKNARRQMDFSLTVWQCYNEYRYSCPAKRYYLILAMALLL